MTILMRLKIPLICLGLFTAISACQPKESDRRFQAVSPYNFAETMQNLDIAISEFNYRIIHRSDIGQAVRDRGEQDFPLSTIVSFCNITYAKEMMLINDDLINDMPCNVAVRETADGVVVSTRLMDETAGGEAQKKFALKINRNLRKIIGATTL
ncbi:MAG: DUF302 domain-containing protein [Methylophaga sp.]